MDCWYEKTCKKYGTNSCNENCIRYMEMNFLINSSNIPKAKHFKNELIPNEIDIQSFKFLANIKQDIVNFVDNGENLYIFSQNFGNGKTTWAIKLMQAYFDKIWAGNGFTVRGLFIHVPSFLTKYKEAMRTKDENFEDLRQNLSKVDLVIWDDIAAEKLTDFDYTNLLTYLDQRKLNGKSNIYTGNLSNDELKIAVGNRLYSRIWNDSSIVEFFGIDRRG